VGTGRRKHLLCPQFFFSAASYGNYINNRILLCEGMKTYTLLWMQHLTHFSFVGRITSLPSSIGDCASLTEVCSFYRILLVSATYVFQKTILSLHWQYISPKSWIQVDLSSNLLTELPEAFGKLCNLKVCDFTYMQEAFTF
jgi:hypothetical protein